MVVNVLLPCMNIHSVCVSGTHKGQKKALDCLKLKS